MTDQERKNMAIVREYKDWNKLQMWEQLGWPIDECLTGERPEDVEPLAPPVH